MLNHPDHTSQENFEALVTAIERGKCAVFIGAGLSTSIGYPSLKDLLWEMAREAELHELQEKEVDDGWADDFQIIKDKLGLNRYREILKRIFDHKKRNQRYNPLLTNILNIPFCAFVTTNYDPCLEFAATNLSLSTKIRRFSYPNLPPTQLTGKHIFHPHGFIDPDKPDSVNTIILSQDEFSDAYEKLQSTYMFFRALFEDLDVLFVGFGWNDIVILSILEKIKQLREIREDIAVKRDFPLSRERSKFAVIDIDTFQRDKNGANYIGRLGIIPIVYEKIGDSHFLLNQLIEEIQRRTAAQTIFPIPTVPEDFLESIGDFHG